MDVTAATAEATIALSTSIAPSSEMTVSTQLPPPDDTTAEVLAAAVVYRVTESNSFGDDFSFTTVYVVERLGEADGFITFSDSAPLIANRRRCSIETALAPLTVFWVHDLEAVIGTDPPVTVPERHAVVMLAEPVIEGDRAEVGVELWCGMVCGIGSTLVVERTESGGWIVTGELGGFVA